MLITQITSKYMNTFIFSVNIDHEAMCLNEEKSLGVHYNSCPKTSKDQKQYPRNCKEILQNGTKHI